MRPLVAAPLESMEQERLVASAFYLLRILQLTTGVRKNSCGSATDGLGRRRAPDGQFRRRATIRGDSKIWIPLLGGSPNMPNGLFDGMRSGELKSATSLFLAFSEFDIGSDPNFLPIFSCTVVRGCMEFVFGVGKKKESALPPSNL